MAKKSTRKEKATFSVQAAATRVGIAPSTLRSWELRYGAVEPERKESGHRRYSQREVERLELLASLSRRGHAIQDLAPLSTKELQEVWGKPAESEAASLLLPAEQEHLNKLLSALESLNIAKFSQEIRWLKIATGARRFVLTVMTSLFAKIGRLVQDGRLDVASEHIISVMLREQLSDTYHSLQLLADAGSEKKNHQIICTTPEGDYHEFGALMAAVLGEMHNFRSSYLGPNMPAGSLIETIKAHRSRILILGNSPAAPEKRPISFGKYLALLDERLPDRVQIWVGGQGDRPSSELPSGRVLQYLNSLHDLDFLLASQAQANSNY